MTSSLYFLGNSAGHLVLRVVSQSPDAPVALVDFPLGFPPTPGSLPSPGLGPLPSPEFLLHFVGCFGVPVSPAVGVGAQGVDAGVDAAGPAGPFRSWAPAASRASGRCTTGRSPSGCWPRSRCPWAGCRPA